MIDNDIKPDNIYNMNENDLFIGRNRYSCTIVCKSSKNLSLVQSNLRELVTLIMSICIDKTKLPLLIIFRFSNYRISNFIHAKKKAKPHWSSWKMPRFIFNSKTNLTCLVAIQNLAFDEEIIKNLNICANAYIIKSYLALLRLSPHIQLICSRAHI